jgi:hypothetical protein
MGDMRALTSEISAEKLLQRLMRELFQTETSAVRHCQREAERVLGCPPADALLAVADHARDTLCELPSLARVEELPVSLAGVYTGALFSELRDKLFDPMTTSERSYRGTLLGARHGLDLVRMLRALADETLRCALFDFCGSWLTARTVLVEELEEQMHWFAQHPERAVRNARLHKRMPRTRPASAP